MFCFRECYSVGWGVIKVVSRIAFSNQKLFTCRVMAVHWRWLSGLTHAYLSLTGPQFFWAYVRPPSVLIKDRLSTKNWDTRPSLREHWDKEIIIYIDHLFFDLLNWVNVIKMCTYESSRMGIWKSKLFRSLKPLRSWDLYSDIFKHILPSLLGQI